MSPSKKITDIRSVLVYLSSAALIAACGGGGGSGSSAIAGGTAAAATATNGSTAGSSTVSGTEPAPVSTTVATADNGGTERPTQTGWINCAQEGGICALSGTSTVRYGVNDSYFYKTVSGSVACNNSFWGDPLFGTSKSCDYSDGTVSAPPEASASAAPPTSPVTSPSTSPAAVPAATPTVAATPAAVAPAAPSASPTLGSQRTSARIMISGHSLTDNPLGDYMGMIAQSMGTPMWWNQQIAGYSTVRARTRGENNADASFSGYSTGKNRYGYGLNIASELANPQTLGGERYDTLLLSERYDLGNTLLWDDTVRYVRHFHDRLIAGNSRANSFLYHPWLEVNKDAPWDWINYERTAAPAWQCVAERINVSLAAANRGDRIAYLPAGLALTDLVERATNGSLPGFSGGGVRQVMDQFFYDNVHLSSRGVYYMALVSYASIYRRSPAGAWAPPGEFTDQQARSLQDLAWQSVSQHYANAGTPTMGQCQARMRDSYCPAFANFRGGAGMLETCRSRLTQQSPDNPFYFNASTDAGYWFPAPR